MGLYYIAFKIYLQQSLFYHVTGFLRKKKKKKKKKKAASIYDWYQCIKDNELTRRLAELENLLF